MGYYASACGYNKLNEKTWNNGDDKTKIVQDNLDNDTVFFMVAMFEDQHQVRSWFLSTCSSNHMIGQKKWLVKFDNIRKRKVKQ